MSAITPATLPLYGSALRTVADFNLKRAEILKGERRKLCLTKALAAVQQSLEYDSKDEKSLKLKEKILSLKRSNEDKLAG